MIQFTRDMSITYEDFFRTLTPILTDFPHTKRDDGVILELPAEGRLDISLGPARKRRIASISLPAVDVTFRFEGIAQPEVDAFMQRFERHFQRGGG